MVSHFVRQFLPILCVACLFTVWCDSGVFAQSDARSPRDRSVREARNPQSASDSNSAAMMREMQATLQKLPWSELSPAAQAKIKNVATGSPIFHRMPQQKVHADPEIYQFLLRHPHMVIGFWEQLGVTELSLRKVRENQYILRETGGTAAAIEVLHRSDDMCIAYVRGEYRGPLLAKGYQGDVILILRTQYTRNAANESVILCDLDTLIQINSLGVDVLVKLFFSSLSKIADSNFEVTMSFVSEVSRAASRMPNSVKDTAEEITSISEEVCVEFCDIVDLVAMRSARRNRPQSLPIAPHLPTVQQQTQAVVVLPETSQKDFAFTTRPPADWGMNHFFDTPSFDVPQSFNESVRYESTDELTAPKLTKPPRTGHTPPQLPKFDW